MNSSYNLEKYLFHKKIFRIKNNEYLKLFENLVKLVNFDRFECSFRVYSKTMCTQRFIVSYMNPNIKELNSLFKFIKSMEKLKGVKLNYNISKKIIDNKIDLKKIKQILLSIDYMQKIKDSRIKLYFEIINYPEKAKQVLSFFRNNKMALELAKTNHLLFAFDFYFNGKTRLKIYPTIYKEDFEDKIISKKIKKFLSKNTIKLIKKCKKINLCFRNDTYGMMVYFQPFEINSFLKIIRTDKKILSLVKKINTSKFCEAGFLISMNLHELELNKIKSMTLYY